MKSFLSVIMKLECGHEKTELTWYCVASQSSVKRMFDKARIENKTCSVCGCDTKPWEMFFKENPDVKITLDSKLTPVKNRVTTLKKETWLACRVCGMPIDAECYEMEMGCTHCGSRDGFALASGKKPISFWEEGENKKTAKVMLSCQHTHTLSKVFKRRSKKTSVKGTLSFCCQCQKMVRVERFLEWEYHVTNGELVSS